MNEQVPHHLNRRWSRRGLVGFLVGIALAVGGGAPVFAGSGEATIFHFTLNGGPLELVAAAGPIERYLQVGPVDYDAGLVTGSVDETQSIQFDTSSGLVRFDGVDTCTCSYDGRSGTVTVRFRGADADGTFAGHFTLTGSGGLLGLRAEGSFAGLDSDGSGTATGELQDR